MCGVYGYVGKSTSVVPLVANALRIMEYRGYDSWGIGWDDGARVSLAKQTGRVPHQVSSAPQATIAIGHTRWATHGGVTNANAHPHTDKLNQIAVVHNGMIENAEELRLQHLSHIDFNSETDSEIVPHLIRNFLDEGETFPGAVRSTFLLLEGSSAIVAMDRSSEMIVAITARSPLRLGRRTDGWELASDPLACAGSSEVIAVIPDNHLVVLTRDAAQMADVHHGGEHAISWEPTPEESHTSRGDYAHFTLKEIHDQVDVLRRLSNDDEGVRSLAEAISTRKHIILTGCGSALYAASLGANWLQQASDAWIDVIPASEINASTRHMGEDTLLIAFTQSGETADVVDAIQIARGWRSTIATIINTETSTIARMANIMLPIQAGVERSVLATKSFMAMAVRMYQVSACISCQEDTDMDSVVDHIEAILEDERIRKIAMNVAERSTMIVLGKGLGKSISQEAALKIKEGSYLHAEAFLMGELKHGPLALVQEGTPCIIFATSNEELASARIAAAEVKSRGGYVVGIGDFDGRECSEVIAVQCDSGLSSLAHLVVAQTLAYHIAIARGVDPDFPRNLAKSVTVR